MNGVIFFDSDCLMCDSFVQWVAKRDKKKYFYYTSGNILENNTNEDISDILALNQKTILYFESFTVFQKANAIQKILFRLGRVYFLFGLFFYLFPNNLRNRVYDFISKNRKIFFKEKRFCSLMDETILSGRIIRTTKDLNDCLGKNMREYLRLSE